MANRTSPFTGLALSGFCMQAHLLFQAALPFYEGFAVMAEDAASEEEKRLLLQMADKLRLGASLTETVRECGCFPSYMEEMIALGEQSGTLDITLSGLAKHYEKEARLSESLRRALTYPVMMICMLFVILFVLFVKIMPIFTDVYAQLGAQIPPLSQTAIRIGGIVSGLALILIILLAAGILILKAARRADLCPEFLSALISRLQSQSAISRLTSLRRFCGTLSVTMKCGLFTDDGFVLAGQMADHPAVASKIGDVRKSVQNGSTFFDAVKDSGLFSGFALQLIRTGERAGKLDSVLEKLAEDYDEKASLKLESLMAQIEPVIITILTVAVGLVLLSVMLPLVGVLSSIG